MRILRKSELEEHSFFQRYVPEESNRVKAIIAGVRRSGDRALRDFSREFDDAVIDEIRVGRDEIEEAYELVEAGAVESIKFAVANVEKFHARQLRSVKEFSLTERGVRLEMKMRPVERVGCYVPGGNYPLPSTAIMTVVPAIVCGVSEVVLCTPPRKQGDVDPVVLVAADVAGAHEIYRVGGAQAIAAMAYGTESIKPVDLVVGPGNRYVQAAKREVFGRVGIDFLAGPSEICIVADSSAPAEILALDLLAQAEHDRDARVLLITDNEKLGHAVAERVQELADETGTREILRRSVDHGVVLLVKKLEEAPEVANRFAPEHLVLMTKRGKRFNDLFTTYGCMFVGRYSAVALGDYVAGTNHTLPTVGGARYTGGLSVFHYLRFPTVVHIGKEGYGRISYHGQNFGRIEGLEGHWRSVIARASQAARRRVGADVVKRKRPARKKKAFKRVVKKAPAKKKKGKRLPRGKSIRPSNAIRGARRSKK